MGKGVAMWPTAVLVVFGLAWALPESDNSMPDCPPGSPDSNNCYANRSEPACSARGVCHCGYCNCNARENPDEIVSGRFCECTNFLCDRFKGQLCGGPTHGACVCNKCECNSGWIGPNCMCEDSMDECIDPYTGEECSGRGICECNQCKCYESHDGRYSGKYCEDCPTCKGNCITYKECVQCQVFRTGEYTDDQCMTHCTSFNATVVGSVVEEEGVRICTFFDENDCRFRFGYGYGEDRKPWVRVQGILECPPPTGRVSFTSLSHSVSSASVVVTLLSLSLVSFIGYV